MGWSGLGGEVRVRHRASRSFRPESDSELGLAWLLRLRSVAVAGQLVVLVFGRVVLELVLPYVALLGLVTFTAVSNAALILWRGAAERRWVLPSVLATDVLVLTAMLSLSGGAANPFSLFFLVHVALAAVALTPRLAWALVWLTIASLAALLLQPAGGVPGYRHPYLAGAWFAYTLASSFIAHFVGRVSNAHRARDRRLAEVARLTAQNERLAALSSFSGNAAHELGTPLTTIGVASKELLLALGRGTSGAALVSDAELICQEVARCRSILADLSARAGESMGEMPVRATLQTVVVDLQRALSPALAERLDVDFAEGARPETSFVAPVKTLVQMLHNLLRNAHEAHEAARVKDKVELRITSGKWLCFHVLDRGHGLSPEVREQLGEPFVTTKSGQGGLGLGVYLARAYAERTNGHLQFLPRPGGGSDVALCLPHDLVRAE
jgi:two-component system, sensor histidine kinase RegB